MTLTKKDRSMTLAAFLIAAVCTLIPALMMQISFSVDELGHLASAAFLTGGDWSDTIHCTGDYYFKYGTALFYYLPMRFILNPVIRYRAFLAAAAIMVSLTAPIAYRIAREFLSVKNETHALLIALISACPASVLFQSNYARSDWAMVVTAWVTLFAFLRTTKAETARSRILYTLLAAAAAVYAYMCHTRGIVTVIALFLAIVLGFLFFRIRSVSLPAYIVTTAGMLLLDKLLSRFFANGIWGRYGRGHAVMESVNLASYRKILTLSGFKIFVKGVVGWLYSIASSTYGLVLAGLLIAVVIVIKGIAARKRQPFAPAELLTALFGSLLFIGNLVLGILFFYHRIENNLTYAAKSRADFLLYERYLICALGILCCLALAFLIRENGAAAPVNAFRTAVCSLVLQILFVIISAVYILPVFDKQSANEKHMVSVTSFTYLIKKNSTALLAAGIAGAAVFALFILLIKWRRTRIALVLMLAAYLFTFGWTWSRNRVGHIAKMAREMSPATEKVMEIYGIHEQYPDLFVGPGARGVRNYQVNLKDFRAFNNKIDRWTFVSDMLVVARGDFDNPGGWEDLYCFDDVNYDPGLKKDVLFVKGDSLKAALEELGYSFTPYTAAFDN